MAVNPSPPVFDAPVEVFRSHSSIEAEVVCGLLAAHEIESFVGSAMSQSVFAVGFGHSEFRICVSSGDADRARELIRSHLDEAAAIELGRLSETLGPLERRINYHFRDLGLLEHALTHRSRAHEDASGGVMDNESLEFLGDAVLGFAIADMLFSRFPTHDEGYKSKVKAGIVSAASLARLAEHIELGRYVLLGRGEEKTGGRHKHAILADGFEALIAAIYLDGGIEAAREFIAACFGPLIAAGGDQAASQRHRHEQTSRVPVPERPERDAHLVARLERRRLPSCTNQKCRRCHLNGPRLRDTLVVGDIEIDPGMRIGPTELFDRTRHDLTLGPIDPGR